MNQSPVKKSTLWFHLFCDFIESGKLAKIKGSSIKIYLVIKSHVNFNNGTANVSIQTIARKSGLSISQTKRGIESLITAGLIKKIKLKRCNNYLINEHIEIKVKDTYQRYNWQYKPSGVTTIYSDIKNLQNNGILPIISELRRSNTSTPQPITKPIEVNEADLASIPKGLRDTLKKNLKASEAKKEHENISNK